MNMRKGRRIIQRKTSEVTEAQDLPALKTLKISVAN
jgi:hypothetical protein